VVPPHAILRTEEESRIRRRATIKPRREFIQKHALEVKDIDYHGA